MIDARCNERSGSSRSVVKLDPSLNCNCRASDSDAGVLWAEEEGRVDDVRGPYRKCWGRNVIGDNRCSRLVRLAEECMM